MPYRKHICIHVTWNHVCICERRTDHTGRDRTGKWQCKSDAPVDSTPPPLFELVDGEMRV